ncbi:MULTISPECIES: glutamine--fructose-6-phosphate transaminase (isomerizing) [Xanthobacter]|uniref:Glutamine--fructose-6-phosphate aminotransferase [isomerizing] n=1 Tax=Xanthobacter flavus TaxID=281 RepID=A0A9W6CGX9_XANFL|nr:MULTISPECIES: glutamine--fructose-6-phosphate transaminase (isomerizing) [Xanthobacter]MBN8918454.1 glutamine--fructose-6-phosphate transaminase (isomerizing) [Hyphomicrobiales bacterium]MDR6332251.1 glucosamine--fructose-6-phosphate aminotransferase (isomerizing) [Xanthobacter flavus]NMN56536.1 glucosamine--fructose-6-phosphate aminotransferase (isomerizing) [Xanthobacter sp. SG618]UDQ89053.1 glutamine--fructose-6-phosphate transaminase (isomerizing) [Xanthobacter autotrophicus]UJX45211.1 
MCGIVGILGKSAVADKVVESLRRLEYRGYDSAGIATLENGHLEICRAEGKLRNLENKLDKHPLKGHAGIGHTRWATHGKPSERNAHPHGTKRVAVVHNGIIENFRELKEDLKAAGVVFRSDTDTEVVAQLVDRELLSGKEPVAAVAAVLPRLKGAFALAFLFDGKTDLMIAARRGSPLAIGYGNGEMFLGSDAIALGPFTDRIAYLEEGDWAVLTREGAEIRDETGRIVERAVQKVPAGALLVDKGNHRHFMAKEIYEQPEVISHTFGHYLDLADETVSLPELPFDAKEVQHISITACGTALYAGAVAEYWLERFGRVPVSTDIASEFRYRETPLAPGGVTIVISQSGETADTLASLRYAKECGQKVVAVVNVPTSTIAREADVVLPILAGPEIGVASTKAFTCQLATLACLSVAFGRAKGVLSAEDEHKLVRAFMEVPRLMTEALKLSPEIEVLARTLAKARDVLYLGRGTNYPLALEGALKLKEISYIHAEGYAGGELKHGPIALIDEKMPVVVIAPHDRIFDKTVSNMEEVAARGGKIILVTDPKGAEAAPVNAVQKLILPEMPATVCPMVYSIPVQLIAYHTAVIMGTDVDQPRNLAKSVTVE